MVSGIKLTEDQVIERINNVCKEKSLHFKGFTEGIWKGAKDTVLILYCPKHDHLWSTTRYPDFVGGKGCGCSYCSIKKRSNNRLKPFSQSVKDFRKVHGNAYEYSEDGYRRQKDPIQIFCKSCQKWFSQTPDNHLQGKGCSCNKSGFCGTKPANLYVVIWSKGNQSFIKVGITNREVNERVYMQSRHTDFIPTYTKIFSHESGTFIKELEQEVLNRFTTGIVPKESFPDGYTETTYLSNYKDLITFITNRMD